MRQETDLKRYHFPERLQKQLAGIPLHPLTIVEAPSGFGKTTALREFLQIKAEQGASEHWYTCFGESLFSSWQGICDLFSNVSSAVAVDLLDLKQPSLDTLFRLSSCLRDIRCEQETYLVVDNYQLMDLDIPYELLHALSAHEDPNLHIVFITQQLKAGQSPLVHNANVHTVDTQSFFFDRDDTRQLFQLEGIRLKDEELEQVFAHTEGWVSAIRLQILNYRESKKVEIDVGIEQLVERAVWNRFSEEEKSFFVAVSVFDQFSASMAARVAGFDVLPDALASLLTGNDFVKPHPDKNLYSIHGILKNYLQNIFEHYTSESLQREMKRRAGDACAEAGDLYAASEFYRAVDDFDAILSLPLTREYFAECREKKRLGLYVWLIDECPMPVLTAHPQTLLHAGYMALDSGLPFVYRTVCEALGRISEGDTGLTEEECHRVRGELSMLRSLGAFNDVEQMSALEREAWDLLKEPSQTVGPDSPFLFGAVSMLSMLWREPGTLALTMEEMDRARNVRLKVTRGSGAGASFALRAEAALLSGVDDEAEILCHKAQSDARSHGEPGLMVVTELTLARIAMLRGDVPAFIRSLEHLREYARNATHRYVFRMAEHSLAVLGVLLGVKEYLPPWASDADHLRRIVCDPEVPIALLLHMKWLIMEERINEFFGVCSLAIEELERSERPARHALARVHYLILMAEVCYAAGRTAEAHEHVRAALASAIPDDMYLPFASSPHMEEMLKETGISAFSQCEDPDTAQSALIELCRRQQDGISAINRALIRKDSLLTPREKEIALLAQQRLSAKEIGEQLFISDKTVRATLRNVYRKLDVHSRAELAEVEL